MMKKVLFSYFLIHPISSGNIDDTFLLQLYIYEQHVGEFNKNYQRFHLKIKYLLSKAD